MVKVSIIMPSLNVAEYIEECLLSVLNQTMHEIEIICIDAGSDDGTWEILQSYAIKNTGCKPIKLLHSDIRSYGYQVNLGIRESQGDYVAVLETDDYVEPEMYQTLYELAIESDADVVKADYDRFITLNNGKKWFQRVKLWAGKEENYNKVICPQYELNLYANDYNIWKGIYKKSFLTGNQIWLNESAGASYQDIGFAEQILACAQKSFYTDASFYRYRLDRESSSINSVNGLHYSHQEFRRIVETPDIYKKVMCEKGLYYHMAQSFLCEYRKTLKSVNYDLESEHLRPYYEWFQKKLKKCLEEDKLPVGEMDGQLVGQIKQLLYDEREYCRSVKEENDETEQRKKRLLKAGEKYELYIFGAGCRGKGVIDFYRQNGIEPKLICDNHDKLWGCEVHGIKVLSPEQCVLRATLHSGVFVIANKLHGADIFRQLVNMGIGREQIVGDYDEFESM